MLVQRHFEPTEGFIVGEEYKRPLTRNPVHTAQDTKELDMGLYLSHK